MAIPWNMTFGGVGGALVSTPADLARFAAALFSGRLLPAAQLAGMRRTVAADPDRLRPGARYGLAQAVRDLRRAVGGRVAAPSPWLADALDFLLTRTGSAYGSAQTAILCDDVAAPRDPEVYWRDLRRAGTRDKLFAPVTNDVVACAFRDPPRERPTKIRSDLPALLVNATGDPRTVYRGAEAVHRAWPSSAW